MTSLLRKTTVQTTSTILAATCEIYEELRKLYPTVQNSDEYFADLALSIAKAEVNGIITDLTTLQAFSQVDQIPEGFLPSLQV